MSGTTKYRPLKQLRINKKLMKFEIILKIQSIISGDGENNFLGKLMLLYNFFSITNISLNMTNNLFYLVFRNINKKKELKF